MRLSISHVSAQLCPKRDSISKVVILVVVTYSLTSLYLLNWNTSNQYTVHCNTQRPRRKFKSPKLVWAFLPTQKHLETEQPKRSRKHSSTKGNTKGVSDVWFRKKTKKTEWLQLETLNEQILNTTILLKERISKNVTNCSRLSRPSSFLLDVVGHMSSHFWEEISIDLRYSHHSDNTVAFIPITQLHRQVFVPKQPKSNCWFEN